MPERPWNYVIIFLLSLLLSYLITPLVGFIATAFKIIDKPAKNKFHKKPTPRLGGVAIFISYSVPLILMNGFDHGARTILLGGFLILIIGIVDDIRRVSAVYKLIFIFIVTLLLTRQGIGLKLFHDLPVISFFLTLLWIAGVTSAFNAVDNMDGLAAGLAFISATAFFIIALRTSQWALAGLSAALIGSTLGFLRYNFHPAKIFMGDSGSLFLGFTFASLGIMGEWSVNPVKASIIPILVLGVPVFDLTYIVIRRWLDGVTKGIIEAITFCAKDHLSHRLISLGLNYRMAVLFIYLISICSSIGAVVLQNAVKGDAVLLFIQFILTFMTVLIIINLTRKLK